MKLLGTRTSLSDAIDIKKQHDLDLHDQASTATITIVMDGDRPATTPYQVRCHHCNGRQPEQGETNPMTENQPDRAWLKLNDGDSATFQILDATPQIHVLHWVQGAAQPHEEADCPWCKASIRKSTRYSILILSDDGANVWEMAELTWKDLQAVRKAAGDLNGMNIQLSRRGTGRQTRYTIVPLGREGVPEHAGRGRQHHDPIRGRGPLGTVDENPLSAQMELVKQDPQGAAAHVKELVKMLKITMKEALANFHADTPDIPNTAPAVMVLAGLTQWLEAKVKDAPDKDAEPELDIALAELLGLDDAKGL